MLTPLHAYTSTCLHLHVLALLQSYVLYLFRALCSSLQLVFWLVQAFHGQFIYDSFITREFRMIRRPSQDLIRVMRRPTDRS